MDAVKDTHGKIDFVFHKIILGKVELMKLWKMNHSENRVPPAEDHSLQSYSAIVVGLCDNRVWIDDDPFFIEILGSHLVSAYASQMGRAFICHFISQSFLDL